MPHSDGSTHGPMMKHMTENLPRDRDLHFLDCGVGAGHMASCIREATKDFPNKIEITGLEIYLPYFTNWTYRSHLKACAHDKYDSVVVGRRGDVFTWLRDARYTYDVIVFGDVLEHLQRWKIDDTLKRAKEQAEFIYVNAPIVDYPQGPKMGNAAEEHKSQLSKEEWEAFDLKHLGGNWAVGGFVWTR